MGEKRRKALVVWWSWRKQYEQELRVRKIRNVSREHFSGGKKGETRLGLDWGRPLITGK